MSLMETEEQRRRGQLEKQQFIDALLETSQQFAERARRMQPPPMEITRKAGMFKAEMSPVQTPPIYQTDPQTKPSLEPIPPNRKPKMGGMFRKGNIEEPIWNPEKQKWELPIDFSRTMGDLAV